MLKLIGLGLCDGKDISLRGKELVQQADAVYLEGYTSVLQCSHEALEKQLGVTITRLTREDVEQQIEPILAEAKTKDVVVLFIGDPFAATTHADLFLRARDAGVDVQVVHGTSILSAVGEVGLELYRYGKTVSVPYWQQGYEPTSFLDGIISNLERGLHTLCLLDIKSDERRFMSVREGIELLERVDANGKLPGNAVGIARLGCQDQTIAVGTFQELKSVDFGNPPHCIVIPGKLHAVEEKMLSVNNL